MTIYFGPPDISKSTLRNLLLSAQTFNEKITNISVQSVYFVQTAESFNEQQEKELLSLLNAHKNRVYKEGDQEYIVVPRFGTISPWSSRASDIARNSGLERVIRIEKGLLYAIEGSRETDRARLNALLSDRMTEQVISSTNDAANIFAQTKPKKLRRVPILKHGVSALAKANRSLGLALTDDEINYLVAEYARLKRDPTDVELMMFAQVNSEHCRHKIFNASWVVDGIKQPKSLFKMIKNTHEKSSKDILSAYSDNAAVLQGPSTKQFSRNTMSRQYEEVVRDDNIVIKVETHNHPTAIAPFPGAATGVGGEIRDEGATGKGARSKIGLAGYSVSNLCIPGFIQPWETKQALPKTIASPLEIMTTAPLGAAAFSNEFGRPNVLGYFRTLEQTHSGQRWGFHKPIMAAGGLGTISTDNVLKDKIRPGNKLVVLGGPAMLIGLGGGAASSMQKGQSEESLDFASVQRANAEMQRRVQEVISACANLGADNPIVSIHDVGAGGLSNALPELVHDSGLGAEFELRDIISADAGMSPLEIWCSEAQERYVLGIDTRDIALLQKLCKRERCPMAVVGTATKKETLVVTDRMHNESAVDIPMALLFGNAPKMVREYTTTKQILKIPRYETIVLDEAIKRVLQFPAVASKKFLVTIGDRNVGGLTTRDQMVGKWQVPVSDVAVSASSFRGKTGQAMSMGERSPLALLNSAAAARMAVAESITNIAAAPIRALSDIKLSANWMAAAGVGHEDQNLYEAVRAVGEEFCPALGVTIPVGKDSLSMRTVWQSGKTAHSVTSPVSLVISAFSPVYDTSKTSTPELNVEAKTQLLLIDLGLGKQRMGASTLAQTYNKIGGETPDIDPGVLSKFFGLIQTFRKQGLLLAYHDRSDGGLFTTLCEMAFCSRAGLRIQLDSLPGTTIEQLFNEELGAVIQIETQDLPVVTAAIEKLLPGAVHQVAQVTEDESVRIYKGKKLLYTKSRATLESWWAQTSYEIQKRRDNEKTASNEFKLIRSDYPGLFTHKEPLLLQTTHKKHPKVAIFREEGVNGHVEMAAAFTEAGFLAVDVHQNDILDDPTLLDSFVGLVACGGFSYGDVLGAGGGWAKSILLNPSLRHAFKFFFERTDTFSLGVCNGCQMLSKLKELIPGADLWPTFVGNTSERFEARMVVAQIRTSPSILFRGMDKACLPIPVAHGEGKVLFSKSTQEKDAIQNNLLALQYVDAPNSPTVQYPLNPNGSRLGMAGFTSIDGRVTIMMPHPERAFLSKQLSWLPNKWKDAPTPWLRLFQNAREWVDENQK